MVCLWSAGWRWRAYVQVRWPLHYLEARTGLWGFNRNCTIKNIFSRSGCHWSGSSRRLTPKNVHQRPTVALLCGPHVQGAQGISCGRHLANHEVEVILFLPNFVKMLEAITSELALFGKTGGKLVSNVKGVTLLHQYLIIIHDTTVYIFTFITIRGGRYNGRHN